MDSGFLGSKCKRGMHALPKNINWNIRRRSRKWLVNLELKKASLSLFQGSFTEEVIEVSVWWASLLEQQPLNFMWKLLNNFSLSPCVNYGYVFLFWRKAHRKHILFLLCYFWFRIHLILEERCKYCTVVLFLNHLRVNCWHFDPSPK